MSPPDQYKGSSTFEWPSFAQASDSFCAQRDHFIKDGTLTWDIGNILMISEGRSGSDNVFTLKDGSFPRSCGWKSLRCRTES